MLNWLLGTWTFHDLTEARIICLPKFSSPQSKWEWWLKPPRSQYLLQSFWGGLDFANHHSSLYNRDGSRWGVKAQLLELQFSSQHRDSKSLEVELVKPAVFTSQMASEPPSPFNIPWIPAREGLPLRQEIDGLQSHTYSPPVCIFWDRR